MSATFEDPDPDGRRNSKTPEEHVRFEAFPGLVGGTAMSPGVQVEYGPMNADDAADDADELAALLQETLRCVERDAPPVANNSLERADISEMVRKKAITAADQLVRGDISWKKWRVRNKIFLRSGAWCCRFKPSTRGRCNFVQIVGGSGCRQQQVGLGGILERRGCFMCTLHAARC